MPARTGMATRVGTRAPIAARSNPEIHVNRSRLFAPILLCALSSSCGDDSTAETAPLVIHGEVELLPGFEYSTGLVPEGADVQASFSLSASGVAAVDAKVQASGSEASPALNGVPGGGRLSVSGGFSMVGQLKVDVTGLSYDGPIPGLDDVEIAITGEATFDPFSVGDDVVAHAEIPPTDLPEIPLSAIGLPGSLLLRVGEGSFLDVTFSPGCAAIDGKAVEYTGAIVRAGTLVIESSVQLEVLGISEAFELPSFSVDLALGSDDLAMEAEVKSFGPKGSGEAAQVGSCSGSSTGGGGQGGGGEGGAGGGQGGGGGEGPACYDETQAGGLPELEVVAHQGLCTSGEIMEVLDACGASGTPASCDAAVQSYPDCATCIGVGPTLPSTQPVFINNGQIAYLNFAPCEAIAQGKDACATPTANLMFCASLTCGACAATDLEGCFGFAAAPPAVCAEAFPISADCETIFDTVSAECADEHQIAQLICGA